MANPFSRGGVSRKDAKAMGDMLAGGKSSARGSIYSRMMREPQPVETRRGTMSSG